MGRVPPFVPPKGKAMQAPITAAGCPPELDATQFGCRTQKAKLKVSWKLPVCQLVCKVLEGSVYHCYQQSYSAVDPASYSTNLPSKKCPLLRQLHDFEGITNCFPIEFEDCLTGGNSHLVL